MVSGRGCVNGLSLELAPRTGSRRRAVGEIVVVDLEVLFECVEFDARLWVEGAWVESGAILVA
jgi:hypothetical protein